MSTSPSTITFPSLEAAVSALCEKAFGAGLRLENPSSNPTPAVIKDITAQRDLYRAKWGEAHMDLHDVVLERETWLEERERLKTALTESIDAWNKDHQEMKRRLDAAKVAEPLPKSLDNITPI